MVSKFAIKQISEENKVQVKDEATQQHRLMRTVTSFGTSLDQDDMILDREED